MLSYPIELTRDSNGTLLATSPDFPELTTFGNDMDDALQHASDALEEAVAARIVKRKDIPPPSEGKMYVALPTLTAAKVLLYQAMQEEGVRKADLARLLNCHMPQIDRLLDVQHASRLDQLDAAFRALHRRMNVTITPE